MSYRALQIFRFVTSIHVFYFYSVSAFMVLSIISSVYSVPWFVYTCIISNGYDFSSVVFYGIQILISLLESIIAIMASAYSCRVFCCGKVKNSGAVLYQNPGTIQYQNPVPQNSGTVLYSPGQGAIAIQNPQTFMVSPGAVGYSQQMTATPMAAPQTAVPQMAAPQTLSNQNFQSASPATTDGEIIGTYVIILKINPVMYSPQIMALQIASSKGSQPQMGSALNGQIA